MPTSTLRDVLTDDTLTTAWHKVRTNQGGAGSDHVDLPTFAQNLWQQLTRLRYEVEHGEYQPKPLLRVDIPKPDGNGTRPLSIPSVRDRVLQTAAALVLTPVFELHFEEISFAYRQGRSVDQAVAEVEQLRQRGFKYVVDADIKGFFDNVDHALLMQKIAALVKDAELLDLIRQWLRTPIIDGKHRFTPKKGIPQGSPLSPLLANLFLDHLDDALLGKNLHIIRYADDFVVLCKTQKRAQKALEITADVLADLKLHFNEEKTRLTHFNRGFRFLGVDFIRSFAFKRPAKSRLPRAKDRRKPAAPPPATPATAPPAPPDNALAEAFYELGITPDQFPPAVSTAAAFDEPDFDAPETPLSRETPDNAALADQPDIDSPSHRLDPILQTLYLLQHGAVLGKKSERFTVSHNDHPAQHIPAVHVDHILVFGNAQITTQAMHYCLQNHKPIYLLSAGGKYYGAIDAFATAPIKLHKQQFMLSDQPEFCLDIAQAFVLGKLKNSQLILKRYARHHALLHFEHAALQLAQIIKRLPSAATLDQLRGFEGNAARVVFQAWAKEFHSDWHFEKRTKNPPTDPINAMLSYSYTILFYNVYSLLLSQGLNPQVGFLHPPRSGHPALASDLMEEFRALIIDTVVLKLALNQRVSPQGFTLPTEEQAACWMDTPTRKTLISEIEKKLNAAVTHPQTGLKIDYRRAIAHQAKSLAAVLRGHQDQYHPFVLR